MAIDLVSAIATSIPNLFIEEGHNLWNRSAKFAARVKKVRGRSAAVNWVVANGANTAVNPGEGDDIQSSEYNQDDRVPMTLNRGIYRSSFGISHSELAIVASLSTDPQVSANLIRERLKDAYLEGLAKIANKIEQDMAAGTGTTLSPKGSSVNNIVGWTNALKTTGSYAGQALSSNPGLVANVQLGVGSVARSNLDLAFASIDNKSGTVPNFIMASPTTCSYLKGIADNQIRLNDNGGMPFREFGLNSSPSTGDSVMSYNGVPIIQNSAWFQAGLDGYVLVGRFEDFALNYMPYAAWGDAVTDRESSLVESNGETIEAISGLPVKVYAVAKTGSSVKFSMELEVQQSIYRPNATAVLTGITGFTANSA